ncbi:MAG: hypothetical protein HW414_982 [Dehalococcoidia bacterium]|nr:hypothetical protein [Dehalococcoidia bacterium]
MNHLVRAGLLLSGVLFFVFVGVRVIPIPSFMADFGFHPRKTETNTLAWANLPLQYAQTSTCSSCHKDNHALWEKGDHKTVSCENCHGPAVAHLETGARPVMDTSRKLCSTCHAQLAARPYDFPQVDTATHGGQAACITCHNPHTPRAGMPPRVPHDCEDRTNCQSCHNPHEPLDVVPPIIPHTVEGRTDCLSCHGPQGTRGNALPRIPHTLEGRTNCLLCHNSGGLKPFPADHAGRTNANCLTCHRSKEG